MPAFHRFAQSGGTPRTKSVSRQVTPTHDERGDAHPHSSGKNRAITIPCALFILRLVSDLEPLFAGSVGERHTENLRRVGAYGEFAFAAIRGNRVGNSFVAEGSQASQDGPKDRLRQG